MTNLLRAALAAVLLLALALPASAQLSGTGTGKPVYDNGPTITDASVSLLGVVETYTAPAISGGTLTINLSLGTVFNVSSNSNISTFTISNAAASKATAFTLFLTGNGSGYTQVWGGSVKWPGGSAPTLTTTNNKTDVLTFVTNDGGTTWFGFVGGQNF